MKKYKMMALTGILLSSTILGANTSVVNAATNSTSDSSNPIKVDTSAITKVINVVNDLLGSSNTANKVNPQVQFSDLATESNQTVTPIFGKKTPSEFATALQSQLNVVGSDGQLVPMTVTKSDDNGFATVVTYTLDGTTKTVDVHYSLTKPTVSFGAGQIMNFDSADTYKTINDFVTNSVTSTKVNGDNAKGDTNTPSISANPTTIPDGAISTKVSFTPSDLYGSGISDEAVVNVYNKPNVVDRTVATEKAITDPYVVKSGDQSYLVTPALASDTKESSSEAVNYTITAIDSLGNPIKDSKTSKVISYNSTGKTTVDTNSNKYTLNFKDAKTGNIVLTADESGKAGTVINGNSSEVTSALNGTGYVLTDNSETTTLDGETQNVDFTVTKTPSTADGKYLYNYIDVSTGDNVGSEELSGNNGTQNVLTLKGIETKYRLVTPSDLIQTLNADQPSKKIYVTPIKSVVKNLSYTVTFKDKDTGKTVGTSSNQGNLGDYIGLTAPDGYAFATIADHGFLLLKDNQNVTKYVTAANVPYNISYVDQDTNKEVGTQSGKGADGDTVTLKAPTDYAFINADDVTYTIDKNDTATKTVYVKKSNQTVDNIVAGYPRNGYIKIYDANGKLNDDVVLSQGSSWIIDQTKAINGVEYYRVATNQYVKASDVYKYVPLQNIVTTKGTNVTPFYNSRGQLVIDLALDTNTPWYTDRSATIKGSAMYRVATDEWVKASDVTINK